MSTYILNIETSTSNCSVCLSKDGLPWIVQTIQNQAAHAEKLTLFVQEVMATAQLSLSDLDTVAVSQGPGSYTGLRIGVSVAKGLCYALDKPLIAVDSLKILAYAAQKEDYQADALYIPLIDARRMDAFAGIYNIDLQEVKKPFFCTLEPNSFEDLVDGKTVKKVILVGNATEKYRSIITHKDIVISNIVYPSAQYMTALAQASFEAKKFEDTAYFEPFYLKMPNVTKAKSVL